MFTNGKTFTVSICKTQILQTENICIFSDLHNCKNENTLNCL